VSRAAGEDVGTYTITPAGDASQGNYSVTYATGTLTITKASAELNAVTATAYSGTYDANAHTITASAAQTGSTLYYSTDNATWNTEAPTWTDVTEAQTVYVKATNPNYEDAFGQATVTIIAKPVTVTANNKSKVYGTADPTLDATVSGTLGTDTVAYTVSRAAGEDVGTYTITPAGDASQGNYSVTYATGTLTITKASAELNAVTATAYSGTYDANAHTITASAAQTGSTLYYSTDNATWNTEAPTWTDVTEAQTVYVKATNPNYEDAFGQANVTINAAELTIITKSASKVFDELALTAEGSIKGFVNNETATFTVTGTQTAVGRSDNTYSLAWDGTAKENNYKLLKNVGVLTVTTQSIDPKDPKTPKDPTDPNSPAYLGVQVGTLKDVMYNGADQAQKPTVVDKDGKALTEGTDYTVSFSSDVKNVGTVTATVKGIGNYSGTVDRTYNITPRAVTLTSGSAEAMYDADNALTDNIITIGGDGFVKGEGATYVTSGSQLLAGSSENTFTYKLNENTLPNNYTITTTNGTLTVKAKITIHYIYADGSKAADDNYVILNGGEPFNITSPTIKGYTADYPFVTGTNVTKSMEYVVTYRATTTPVPPIKPTPGRSCQDDGFPAGYYWSEAAQACVIDIVPANPVNPPVNPVNPGNPVIVLPENPAGGGAQVTPNENGSVTVTPIQETQTPLSKFETAHKCNILPFIFTLLALLVLILFTKDAKKRQKHIHELKEELELRKLGIDPDSIHADAPAAEAAADPASDHAA